MKLFTYNIINLSLIISMSDPTLASGKGGGQESCSDSDSREIHKTSPRQNPHLSAKTQERQNELHSTSKKSPLHYEEAKKLYESKDENDKKSGRSALYSLVDTYSWKSLEAAVLLFKSDHENDKVLGRKALCSIAQKENVSRLNVDAAELLFKSLELSDKEIGRKILYDAVVHPQKYYKNKYSIHNEKDYQNNIHFIHDSDFLYQDQLLVQISTANTLIEKGNEEDQQIAMGALERTYFLASESISGNYREKAENIFRLMGENSNPLQLEALKILLRKGNEKSRDSAISDLLHLAKKGQYKAAQSLSTRLNTRDEKAYLEGMNYIAQIVDHPNRYEAAKILYDLGRDYSNEGKKALIEISELNNHPKQKEAIEALEFCNII